jgi:ATP-binding cassette subfamily B (MDR/TAP) protein 1
MVQSAAMFIAGFIIAFSKGWLMTLVVLAAIPVLGISGIIYMSGIQNK